MDFNQLKNNYDNCCQLVTEKKLTEAFELLQGLINQTQKGDYLITQENYRDTYQNILIYSFGEIEDPARKQVYFRLLKNVLELADSVYEEIIVTKNLLPYSYQKKWITWEGKNIETSEYPNLFEFFWLSDRYLETEKEIIHKLITGTETPWWDKCVLVSAITLSCLRYFDENKILVLADLYLNGEKQVKQRALVGLTLCLFQYNKRMFLYPVIKSAIDILREEVSFEKHTELILLQFAKTRETEKISRKFREEIMPEMAKIQSRIYDKLDLKNLIPDPLQDDKNPDWENVFQDSPNLLNKLEEMSMLQMEGTDVFLGTFSMLKHFDFFNHINNWFVPFYKENKMLSQALTDDSGQFNSNEFSVNMENSSVLCNSDKYSFCLNMQFIPGKDRSMMAQMFNMEAMALKEMQDDDDLLKKPNSERIIYTQYIQDLYRFYKLYPHNKGFFNIFSTRIDFQNTEIFGWIINNPEVIRNLGEFYFEKGYYTEAIEIFSLLNIQTENFELWQKIAYSWQKLGDYEKALAFYLKAEIADTQNIWNIKKIAFCYRRLGNTEKALEYYQAAEKFEPENLQIQANLAHTYFENKDYENALNIYFKVEYLAPDNGKIQRPIAWCSFILGKLDTSKKYYDKILQGEINQNDWLNAGHAEWCLGNKSQAIEKYQRALELSGKDILWFTSEFIEDSELLVKQGIDPVDIPLMRDYIIS